MGEVRVDPLTGLRTILLSGDEPALDPAAVEMPAQTPPDLFTALPARGAHERLAPTLPLRALDGDGLAALLDGWRVRIGAHVAQGAACVHVTADESGTADLYALGFVPAAVARERERFGAYAVRTMGQNLLGDLVQEEVRRRERIVAVDEEAVVFAPYASRAPYQLLLAPRRPRGRFEDEGPSGAALLADVIGRLGRVLGTEAGLDLWVRTAPAGADAFCWRIDVLPRRARATGLELGTGLALTTVSPEHAAAQLREA